MVFQTTKTKLPNAGAHSPYITRNHDELVKDVCGSFGRRIDVGRKMNTTTGLTRRRQCASFDNLQTITIEEETTNTNSARRKPHFLRRIFRRKYGKLRRSKSDENLTEALNISIEDTKNQELRDRSRTVPAELWAENEEKTKRRGAVCEGDDEKREEFTKILETFMIRKSMDDYGF